MLRSKYAIARERIGHISLCERLLLAFSRHPDEIEGGYNGYAETLESFWVEPDALRNLLARFPNFRWLIKGKTVMDFGCGDGQQAAALALSDAKLVLGVESEPIRLQRAFTLCKTIPNVGFAAAPSGRFDVIISQNSFEHFVDPRATLQVMLSHLKPGGKLLITYGPPWYAPYGAHMHFFTRLPWVHLLFAERTVLRVRNAFRRPIAGEGQNYRDDMNGLSIAGFLRLVREAKVERSMLELSAMKGMRFLTWLPWIRELFVINVTCILTAPESPARSDRRQPAAAHSSSCRA